MAADGKTYIVEDADDGSDADGGTDPEGTGTPFPGTLAGLLDALDAARYGSAAGAPKAVVIAEGKQRTIIRRLEGGNEVWLASRAEIRSECGNGPSSRRGREMSAASERFPSRWYRGDEERR